MQHRSVEARVLCALTIPDQESLDRCLTLCADHSEKVNGVVIYEFTGTDLHEHGSRCGVGWPPYLFPFKPAFKIDSLSGSLYDFPRFSQGTLLWITIAGILISQWLGQNPTSVPEVRERTRWERLSRHRRGLNHSGK